MAETKRKSKTGAPRTEVFAMRLDPKLKYLAEIAARRQRRSLANFIEWTIEQAFEKVYLIEPGDGEIGVSRKTVTDASAELWALDESDRFLQLAKNYPELLTYDEQLIWRVICEYSLFEKEWGEHIQFRKQLDAQPHFDNTLTRKCWKEIKAYALGSGTRKELDLVVSENYMPF